MKNSVKMIVSCIILLLLHQGHTLVPVITVQLGEPVVFTCVLTDSEYMAEQLHWLKQSVGDNMRQIVSLLKHATPMHGPEFSASRMALNTSKTVSTLTILRTIQEDEGMYHCAVIGWIDITWKGTLLLINGNPPQISNYTVIQRQTVSDPGAPMTLQCSVLSESKTCPGDHTVFWFRVGSDKSQPSIIYTDGNGRDKCDKRNDTERSCVYHLSKYISSSDVGTYYCAVATCGEILFGDGTKVDIQDYPSGSSKCSLTQHATVLILFALLAVSLFIIAFLIYAIKKKCDCCNDAVAVQNNSVDQKSHQRDDDVWVYSAAVFTMITTDRGSIKDAKAADRERIYVAMKAFGFDCKWKTLD